MNKLKVLQVCHKMPWPQHDGGAYSLYVNALGLLKQGAELKVLAVNTPRHWVAPDELPEEFTKKTSFESHRIDTRINPWKMFKNLFGKESYFVERFWSEGFQNHLVRILSEENFDVVQLEHSYLGLYIDTLRKHSKAIIILRPQNVEHQVWFRVLKSIKNPLKKLLIKIATKRLKQFEKSIANQVDGIIAISPHDKKLFTLAAPNTPIINIPVGFDFSNTKINFSRTSQNPVKFYHLGSMDWAPNKEGIQWFVKEVLPVVVKKYWDFEFTIAGKSMPLPFFKMQSGNLKVNGRVEDATAFHQAHHVLIVPLLSGGGIRVKIIEAMALGKTVISTSIGAEGIPYTNGKDILIADTVREFARQVSVCIANPSLLADIGNNANTLASSHFDLDITSKRMIEFYNQIIV